MSYPNHDFEAMLSFLTPEEGGRACPAFQGYRPDFYYEEDLAQGWDSGPVPGWMIWPMFFDSNGDVFPPNTPVPQNVHAGMMILNPELRRTVHQSRIKVGTRFVLCEGRHLAAKGVVTKAILPEE